MRSLTAPFFPEPCVVSQQDLLDYYGPPAPPPSLEDPLPTVVTLNLLRNCLAAAPPLSSPHRDGCRNEHLAELAKDPECGTALARVLTAVVNWGNVP